MKLQLLRAACALTLACVALAASAATANATPDTRLLDMYQPVTHFHPLEPFLPTSVQAFIADSDLEQFAGGAWTLVDASPEPGELPATGAWRLNQDSCSPAAALGGLECYQAAWHEGSGGPVVYARVAREADRIVLQYWYFYYDDVYSYPYAPAGTFWQAHEGDWEVVNVVLSEDEEPLSVAYSQHCLGQRRAWSATPRVDGTHPIVYVALGSHANYFEPGLHPFHLACVPPAALALLQQLHLPPPADVAAGDPFDRVTTIRRLTEGWLEFPGFWGELQYFHAPPPIGTVPLGTSPQGPAFHAVWTNPLATIASWPEG